MSRRVVFNQDGFADVNWHTIPDHMSDYEGLRYAAFQHVTTFMGYDKDSKPYYVTLEHDGDTVRIGYANPRPGFYVGRIVKLIKNTELSERHDC